MDRRKLILSILRKVWYTIATLIVLAALLLTIARLITPLLNDHRPAFEQWAQKLLDAPVKIGKLEAWWQGFQPDLKLENVAVYSSDHKKVVIRIHELRIDIGIIRSLIARRIEPSQLEIWGVHLSVNQTADNHFTVKGINGQSPEHRDKELGVLSYQNMLDWLFSQRSLSLHQIQIDWSRSNKQIWPALIRQLHFSNHGKQHHLYGVMTLEESNAPQVTVNISLKGNVNRLDKSAIVAYFKLQHVVLNRWLQNRIFYNYRITNGLFNGEIWARWKNKKLKSVQSLFDVNGLHLLAKDSKKPIKINHLSSNLYWSPIKNGWQLALGDLRLNTEILSWPKNELYLAIQNQHHVNSQTLWIKNINLTDIKRLLSKGSIVAASLRQMIKALNPSGQLHALLIEHYGDFKKITNFYIGSRFDHLTFNRWKDFPSVKNLSGSLSVSPYSGTLSLDSQRLIFDFGKLFLQPIHLNYLNAKAHWSRDRRGVWTVISNRYKGENDHIAFDGKLKLIIPRDHHRTILNLLLGFTVNDSSQAKYYLPRTVIHQKALNWLDNAFPKGPGGSGTVIIRGPIAQFPFDWNQGVFEVNSDMNTDLHYAPNWPNAKNIHANLIFKGCSMICDANAGNFYGAKIIHAHAIIPIMHDRRPLNLELTGNVVSDANDFMRFLLHSPLSESFGEDFSLLKLQGDSNLNIKIHLPLEKLQNSTVSGDVNFSKVTLSIPTWNLMAHHLTGKLLFAQNGLSAHALTATLFDHPTAFSIEKVQHKNAKSLTRISWQSHANIDTLEKTFHWPNVPYAKGVLNYHAVVDLHTSKGDTRQNLLSVSSDLRGISINLPPLLTKTSGQLLPFGVYFRFGAHQPTNALIWLGNNISSALSYHLINKKLKLYSANLHLGEGIAKEQKEKGLYIDGTIPEFNWQTWKKSFEQAEAKVSKNLSSGFNQAFRVFLREINLKVKRTKLLGQPISHVNARIVPQENQWRIGILNTRMDGYVIVPDNYPQGALVGRFKKLYLQEIPAVQDKSNNFNPGTIPPLDMQANQFRYGKKTFGSVHLVSVPQTNTMRIKQLTFSSSLLAGNLTGSWQRYNNGGYFSKLSGDLTTQSVTDLLHSMEIDTSLLAKRGEASINLSWPGKITDFELNKMAGRVSLHFYKGQIVNLGDRANTQLNLGRLLSVLNINRVLTLSFSDLTQSGYSFDEMRGDFNLQSGRVTTNDLFFDGQVARIDVKGMIHLLKKTLDLNLVVTPYLTSSLPVIATVAGGPIAGAVTWVADKLIGKTVDKIKQYRYHMTGTFKSPKVKSI